MTWLLRSKSLAAAKSAEDSGEGTGTPALVQALEVHPAPGGLWCGVAPGLVQGT